MRLLVKKQARKRRTETGLDPHAVRRTTFSWVVVCWGALFSFLRFSDFFFNSVKVFTFISREWQTFSFFKLPPYYLRTACSGLVFSCWPCRAGLVSSAGCSRSQSGDCLPLQPLLYFWARNLPAAPLETLHGLPGGAGGEQSRLGWVILLLASGHTPVILQNFLWVQWWACHPRESKALLKSRSSIH